MRKLLPPVDQGVAALLTDLHQRGLSEKVIVMVCSEFGRTPYITSGRDGRDHWSNANSILLAGGGINHGLVVGRTDKQGGEVLERPVTPEDLAHTLFKLLKIDIKAPDLLPDGQRIVTQGAVIDELF